MRSLEQGLLDISNELGAFGYAFVDVTPQIKTDPTTGMLDIAVNIGQARRNFVERIEFVDNRRTLDSVIRREFELVEGDAYNQLKLIGLLEMSVTLAISVWTCKISGEALPTKLSLGSLFKNSQQVIFRLALAIHLWIKQP